MNLNDLAQEILDINTANGWSVTVPKDWIDSYKVPAILALIHSEVSEALEAFRHSDRENFEEEIANTIIRCLDLTAGMGIDIEKAVRDKMEINRGRGYKHGGKRV